MERERFSTPQPESDPKPQSTWDKFRKALRPERFIRNRAEVREDEWRSAWASLEIRELLSTGIEFDPAQIMEAKELLSNDELARETRFIPGGLQRDQLLALLAERGERLWWDFAADLKQDKIEEAVQTQPGLLSVDPHLQQRYEMQDSPFGGLTYEEQVEWAHSNGFSRPLTTEELLYVWLRRVQSGEPVLLAGEGADLVILRLANEVRTSDNVHLGHSTLTITPDGSRYFQFFESFPDDRRKANAGIISGIFISVD